MDKKIIHTVFEACAAAHPAAPAVAGDGETVSYGQLNAYANRLAVLLREDCRLGGGVVVGGLLPPGVACVYTMIAVFKSGNVFMPLGEGFKDRHYDKIYGDVAPALVVTTPRGLPGITRLSRQYPRPIPALVVVDPGAHRFRAYRWADGAYVPAGGETTHPDGNPGYDVGPGDGNYLYFTSGTTGTPKAILGQHKSLGQFIHWETDALRVTAADRVSQLASLTFDASLRDIWLPLTNGGTLCIPPRAAAGNAVALLEWLQAADVTVVHTVPSVFRLFCDAREKGLLPGGFDLPRLRYLLLSGEMLYNRDVQRWRDGFGLRTQLVNLYGPTEATMIRTHYRVGELTGGPGERVPVGQPIAATRVLVLTDAGALCDAGEVGNIYLKTPFLTKGYYGDQAATANIFVPNPLEPGDPLPVCRTGDYGKYTGPERDLVVLGRRDNVVKANGVRINLDDIEHALLGCGQVRQVKCVQWNGGGEESQLVCYYQAAPGFSAADLRAYADGRLAAYERMDCYLPVAEFPRNANGKIDAAALPAPGESRPDPAPAPATDTEARLAALWQALIPLAKAPGATADFFAAGGNSLKLHRLANAVQQAFGVRPDLGQLFRHTTLGEQGRLVDALRQDGPGDLRAVPPAADYPLSSAQRRIWLSCQSAGYAAAYNMPRALRLAGDADAGALRQSFDWLVQRHEILRTRYLVNARGELRQRVVPGEAVSVPWEEVDLRAAADKAGVLDELLREDAQRPLDLAGAPLLRAKLVRLGEREWALYLVVHHIACDEWSMGILRGELLHVYEALRTGQPVQLPDLPIQYRDYADWCHRQAARAETAAEAYWRAQFAVPVPEQYLPFDYPRQTPDSYAGERIPLAADEALLGQIDAFRQAHGLSASMFFTAALFILLHHHSGNEDLVIGMPVTVRNHPWLENQLGPYLNMIALRAPVSGRDTVQGFCGKVKELVRQSYQYLDFPFDRVMDFIRAEKSPAFQAAINVVDLPGVPEPPAGGVEELTMIYRKSKFPLCLYVVTEGPATRLCFEYSQELFERKTVRQMAAQYERIIADMVGQPGSLLARTGTARKITLPDLFAGEPVE